MKLTIPLDYSPFSNTYSNAPFLIALIKILIWRLLKFKPFSLIKIHPRLMENLIRLRKNGARLIWIRLIKKRFVCGLKEH